MPISRLDKLLKSAPAGSLDKIIQHAQEMEGLTERLRQALGPELGRELVAANLRESGELVLICSSSAWAARLRFEADRLVELLCASGERVSGCRVKVSP
ncbi:MAG: DUF721 domain-containing protein [Gammaproteobacteria bacterium]|nr:DUF721 domain-containing protein [Gammaproteobacteria bacterium]MDH4253800.1 DUF721 domain-containing protein [Gammaproteobacteria bacterium]MDH5308627.1 DUF721 domain-containing protein [Gammaproteobacteria bacterium]